MWTALVVLGLLLSAVPILAEDPGGAGLPWEIATHQATGVTDVSASLHGYLDTPGDDTRGASPREPARLYLICDADVPPAPVDALDVEGHSVLGSALRLRRVTLASWVGDPFAVASGDELVLDLFADASYSAAVDRVSIDTQGTISVRGRLDNCPASYVVMSTHQGRTLASVRIPGQGRHYLIVYEPGAGEHYLVELDPTSLDEVQVSPAILPPPTGQEEDLDAVQVQVGVISDLGPEDHATIDVMVVYTPAARAWADANKGSIHNVIAQAMEKAELVMDNSDTGASLRLVHSAEVDYDERHDNSATHLERLTHPGDGYMDEVHDWRDQYGADLVALFAEVHDVGGVAWLLNDRNGRPAYAFSLTRVQQASVRYTHIHEMGHNMGCHHHKQQSFQPGPTIWQNWPENTWSAGWRWIGQDNVSYCSVMTYGWPDTQVAYFSNPAVYHRGRRTGHSVDGDNARTIRELKHVIAAYRRSVEEVYVSFEWWADPEDKNETTPEPMCGPGPFSKGIDGLQPGTTYYFRAKAMADDVIAYGDELSFTTTGAANDTVTVSIQPEEQQVTHGDTFHVDLAVDLVKDFGGCEFSITYDPTIVTVTDVTDGSIDGHAIGVDSWSYRNGGGDDTGTVEVSTSAPEPGVTGTGHLARVHFAVLGFPGDSSAIALEGVTMRDYTGQETPTDTMDGAVQIVAPGYTVIFVVEDLAEQPVAGAIVELQGVGAETTDADGRAEFGVVSGHYTYMVSMDGYLTSEGTVDVVDEGVTVDVTLHLPPARIEGQARQVNCEILIGVTVILYDGDDVEVDSTSSDGAGDYALVVAGFGEYRVVAGKEGFRDREQIVGVTGPEIYTVNFVGKNGLIPNKIGGMYFSGLMSLYLFGTGDCALDGMTFSGLMSAYLNPV